MALVAELWHTAAPVRSWYAAALHTRES
jgi:hypothetical protein